MGRLSQYVIPIRRHRVRKKRVRRNDFEHSLQQLARIQYTLLQSRHSNAFVVSKVKF